MSIERIDAAAPSGEREAVLRLTEGATGVTLAALPYPPAIPMNFSVWWRADAAVAAALDVLGSRVTLTVPVAWTRLSLSVAEPRGREVSIYPAANTPVYLCMAQLEQGGAASDWRAAPEDDAEALRQAILQVTPERILAVVTDSDEYRALNAAIEQQADQLALRATREELSGVDGRLSAAEAKLSPEAIVSTVRASAGYRGDLSGKADATALAQTATSLRADVTSGDLASGALRNSAAEMTADGVKIATGSFNVDIRGTAGQDLQLDGTGAWFRRACAPNLMEVWVDGASLTVGPSDSLTAALSRLDNKCVPENVTVSFVGDSAGDAVLTGCVGGGRVTIDGAGHTLRGRLEIAANACVVEVRNLRIESGSECAVQRGGYVHYRNCAFVTGGYSGDNLVIYEGGRALVEGCFFQGAHASNGLLVVGHGADVTAVNSRGGTTGSCVKNDGGTLKLSGTRPLGGYLAVNNPVTSPADFLNSVPVDQTGYSAGTAVAARTAYSFSPSAAASVAGDGADWAGDACRVGVYGGPRWRAALWFGGSPALTALNGRQVLSAALSLARGGGGQNGTAELCLASVRNAPMTGAPSVIADYGRIAALRKGSATKLSIPAQAVQDILSGGGLMLYNADAAPLSGRAYSANYAELDAGPLEVWV